MDDKQRTNGTRWLGIPVSQWVTFFQGVGLPTCLILFGLWMAARHVPPIVQGHVELLSTTRDTLQQMDQTLRVNSALTEELVRNQRESTGVWQQIQQDNAQALEDHRQIMRQIEEMSR